MKMAVNKIRVNTDSLHQTQQNLQEKLKKIQKEIEQIATDMETLNAMWTGEAHDAFVQSAESDIQYLTSVCDQIQGIINYEGNAVKEYNRCEQQVSDLISRIRV